MQLWCRTWPSNGSSRTRAEQKLLRIRKGACKSSWSRIGSQKSMILTIRWKLAKPVKTYRGICKYSQLHRNAFHDDDHDCHTTSRLQPTRQRVGALPQSHPGPCGSRHGHPRYRGGPYAGRLWEALDQHHDDRQRQV